MISGVFAAAAGAWVRAFLAPTCAACDTELSRPLDGPVCPACWASIAVVGHPMCARCGDAVPSLREAVSICARCQRRSPRFSAARSVGRYEGALLEILHAFKYSGRRVLARPLAQMMRHSGAEVLDDADLVVPVPLHRLRAFHRGFNQADDLACHLGLPVWRVLRRSRHGPPQASLPAARRHANVAAAFTLAAWSPFELIGLPCAGRGRRRVVVLVDDVMTTGATLDACAGVLLDAGVRSVRALTVARAVAAPRAPRPRPRRPSAAPRR